MAQGVDKAPMDIYTRPYDWSRGYQDGNESMEVRMANSEGRSSLSISKSTKASMDSIKHAGQSYDGVIQELVKFWKSKGQQNKTP